MGSGSYRRNIAPLAPLRPSSLFNQPDTSLAQTKTPRYTGHIDNDNDGANMTIQDTLTQREQTHGSFETHAELSQALKRTMHCSENWRSLSDEQRESLEMIQHKITRILNGNPDHADHWHDVAGYATLCEKQ